MNNIQSSTMNIQEALFSNDPKAINNALKILYMDAKVNAKIQEWSRSYNLKSKEPDDILQEGIMILFNKIQNNTFRKESNVKTFLLGICNKLILSSVSKKEIVKFQGDFQESEENNIIPSDDHFGDIEKTESEQQRDDTLKEIIEQMDEKCQKALKLFYYQKKKMLEVAEETNLKNANQAKKAVSRCRQKLRAVILSNPVLIQLLKQAS